MANSEGYTYEDALQLEYIGQYRSNWRRRTISLYVHPTDAAKVVSVGVPFDKSYDPVVCIEERRQYGRQLEYDDWSDTN